MPRIVALLLAFWSTRWEAYDVVRARNLLGDGAYSLVGGGRLGIAYCVAVPTRRFLLFPLPHTASNSVAEPEIGLSSAVGDRLDE